MERLAECSGLDRVSGGDSEITSEWQIKMFRLSVIQGKGGSKFKKVMQLHDESANLHSRIGFFIISF